MHNYEKAARPVVNASTALTVKIGFVLTQISSVDERNQVLTVNVWLEQVRLNTHGADSAHSNILISKICFCSIGCNMYFAYIFC